MRQAEWQGVLCFEDLPLDLLRYYPFRTRAAFTGSGLVSREAVERSARSVVHQCKARIGQAI